MSVVHLQAATGLTRALRRHPPLRGGLRRAGRRLRATVHEWRRRARERSELLGLDERALADIGLSRAVHATLRRLALPQRNVAPEFDRFPWF